MHIKFLKVVESGTHQELVDKREEYYEMLMAQSLTESEQKGEQSDGKDPALRQFSNESFADVGIRFSTRV